MSEACRRFSPAPVLVWTVALFLALVVMSLAPRPVRAQATINVTTNLDNMTAPCTGVPPCTLRGAILQANTDPGSTINVPSGLSPYVLDHTHGSLTITAPVTIQSAGGGNAVVNGQDATNQVPVLVNNAAGAVVLSGLTVENGLSVTLTLAGGISSTGSTGTNGNMTLRNVIVANNTGVVAGGILSSGTLTMTDSSVTGNTETSNGFNNPAGGIQAAGTLTMTNGTVSGNTGNGGAGAIYALGAGAYTLNNVVVDGNNGASAGGIVSLGNFANLTLNGGSISHNTANSINGTVGGVSGGAGVLTADGTSFSSNTGPLGGGILDTGTLVLNKASIVGNTSGFQGGGIVVGFSRPGFPGLPGTATIDQTTITNNSTGTTPGAGGAGIYVHDGSTLTLTRSLVAGNRTAGGGGGLLATGNGSAVGLTNNTFYGNFATAGGGGIFQGRPPGLPARTRAGTDNLATPARAAAPGRAPAAPPAPGLTLDLGTVASNTAGAGGGLNNGAPGSPFRVHNSIVALNAATGSGSNCQGSLTSQGYNLENASTCGFTGAGDSRNTDPVLDGLSNNGGPNQTMALFPSSPAIDTADPSCPAGGDEATDQRGVARPIGRACDKGAFEAPAVPAPPATGKV